MEAFATIADLELMFEAANREYDLSDDAADALLLMASASVREAFSSSRREIDQDDEWQAAKIRNVVCSMVLRFTAQKGADGASSVSQAIGSTSVSVSYHDPTYSFTLLPSELKDLGLSGRRGYRSVRAAIHDRDGSPVEGW